MRVSKLELHNWRNFVNVSCAIESRLFVVGPNAAGKSNFLDAFRFLYDLAAPGGGLASAVARRGGLERIRSLYAPEGPAGTFSLAAAFHDDAAQWTYFLEVGLENGTHGRPCVVGERVVRNGSVLLERPSGQDAEDPELLVQTHLEQVSANQSFRAVATYLANAQYFHLVPQLVRDPTLAAATTGDSYGTGFISDISCLDNNGSGQRMVGRMEAVLRQAIPSLESLSTVTDAGGAPHLNARFEHWPDSAQGHNEASFSDGTLRLLGIVWTLLRHADTGGVVLLEEPELSLNPHIVQHLPAVLSSALEGSTSQVVATTHSTDILDDEGVNPREVLLMSPSPHGTVATSLEDLAEVSPLLDAGIPFSQILDTHYDRTNVSQLLAAARKLGE